jgi:enoyl-CoA hydratase
LSGPPIRLEREGGVAQMVLEDPPLNLYSDRTYEALRECLDELESSDPRALVWRAEGKLFTGGVDVHVFDRMIQGGGGELGGSLLYGSLLEPVRRIEKLPFPTIALVHGTCLTWGLEIALGMDMIWASESARFGLFEARLGLTPGAGGTQRIAHRAGPARAAEFVMTADLYDAATLHEWGVVNRVVADDALLDEGLEFVRRLAAGPTKAHAITKRIIHAYKTGGVEEADRLTPDITGTLFHTEDLQSAVKKFLADGPGTATFEGR